MQGVICHGKIYNTFGHICNMQSRDQYYARVSIHWCNLLFICGSINGTHIFITKAPRIFDKNYNYYKTMGFSIVYQIVIDVNKNFTNLYIGMSNSRHDPRILQLSRLYHKAQHHGLFDNITKGCQNRILPYLIANKRYLCGR
jgi:hypothetical protein